MISKEKYYNNFGLDKKYKNQSCVTCNKNGVINYFVVIFFENMENKTSFELIIIFC